MTKRKICLCIDSLNIGGAERLVIDLINHWSDTWDIYLVTFLERNELKPAINEGRLIEHKILGADCSRISAIIAMFKFCKNNQIQSVLCHLERPNKWLAIGARLAGVGVVTTVHNINIYSKIPSWKKFGIRCLYNFVPQKIIAISDSVKNYLVSLGVKARKIEIICNGVDVGYLQYRYPLLRLQKKLAFVVLARLEPVKALDVLLEALASFNNRERTWSLRIIGDGSQRQALEGQAQQLGISDKIEFVGAQGEPLRYLQDRHVICMPSHREGLPIALLESLSIGNRSQGSPF